MTIKMPIWFFAALTLACFALGFTLGRMP